MKVTKLDNKKLNEEELRSNQNMHKPEDVHIHADIPYGVARDEDTAAQEHAEEVYDALEKDASSVTPKDPDDGNVKIPKNMYAEKIALDESLFTEDVDDGTVDSYVAQFLKDSVEWLIEEDEGCSTYKLDDRLGICVGWQDGYGSNDESIIHSNSDPTYAVIAGIKVYTSDDMRTDYDWINYPYFANGEVVDVSVTISPDENYDELADYFLKEYFTMADWEIEEDGLVIKSDDGEEDAVEEALNEAKVRETTYFDGKDYNIFGKKIFVIGTTSETRDYNWEDIEVKDADPNVWKVIGSGRYKWLNRPWQNFTYAEALRKALVNAFGKEHEKEISDAIANGHSVDGALAILAGGAKESLSPKHRREVRESKSLKEGTSNFWSMDKFPLLVFMDYDLVYDKAFDDTIKELGYPDIEMDEEITDTPEFEKNFEIESQGVATLAEWDLGELEEVIGDFNDKLKNEYYENHAEDWDGDDDARVELKDGYYEGCQIYVPNERYLADWQADMINDFLKTLKEKYGLTELGVSYRASNGETGYHKIGEKLHTAHEMDADGDWVEYSVHIFPEANKRGFSARRGKNGKDIAFDTIKEAQKYADTNFADAELIMIRKEENGTSGPILKRENGKWQKLADTHYDKIADWDDSKAYGIDESKELTENKGKVEGEDDNVYQLVYDALFLGNKNFRPHIADEAGSVYDWEQSLIMLPGYNDYDLGIALEKEEDGKYAKAVADKLGLKYEIKPTSSLSDGYKFIATVRIPDDIANKDATEYVTSIGLDMNTIRPKKTKKK